MAPPSFRDILAQLLKAEAPKSQPKAAASQTQMGPQITDIPFVFIDKRTTFAKKVRTNGYVLKSKPFCHKQTQISKDPLVFSRESLSREGLAALETLLRLGALGLESELTDTLIKKAYRRLLKFYHPDHYPFDLPPEDRKLRSEQFFALQVAYRTLAKDMSPVAPTPTQP